MEGEKGGERNQKSLTRETVTVIQEGVKVMQTRLWEGWTDQVVRCGLCFEVRTAQFVDR